MFFRLAEQKETTLLKTLTLFLSAAIAATTTSELRAMPIQPLSDRSPMVVRAICMGVVPIRVDIMGGAGGTAAHPATGLARGVTAATRRSTEGIRTGRGIRPRLTSSSSETGGFRDAFSVGRIARVPLSRRFD